ncbi:hypothetical protein PDJAM_G00028250 [Pangasius djambal]|uniref:Uncharacterized protein n=1 Tax=Pangasius djambal TaxID=1691987 RepID=A0ACC5YQA9_9TELE|nr:hypothetical protein [Pangasius djambal]
MPEEWRNSVLVPIFKNKGDVQSCSNYRGIKLMSHTMKLWERVVEARLRKVVEICEQQYGFMPRKSTKNAIFALRILMEKYRDGQRELHCVFVDLEKAYDRVPREELWYCMRKSGVAEKYVRVVQDMYERSGTVVRCAVGQTEEFKVEVGLQSPFLFAMVMDQLSEEVRQESPYTMMFADDIVICSESREQVEENLERWRCWAVVEIVPQMAFVPVLEERLLNTTLVRMETTQPVHTFIYSNISLEESEKAGEIATIPLTKIINQRYTHFSWVAELIQIFITISITVSFLVMGSAMKHTIDGLVNRRWERNADSMLRIQPWNLPQLFHTVSVRSFSGGFLSFLVFGIIFIVSMCDPKGFVIMLDKVVSFSLNTEVGLFIFLMLRASRSDRFKHMTVPLPAGESLFKLHWLLPVYFLFAVAYDLSLSVLDISKNMYHSSQTNRSLM